jgi:antitoxin component of MazEF toxin-antitoxin module
MKRFKKMYYYTSKGEKKLNCYYITIQKALVEQLNLQDEELQIKIENNKIVIDKKK